MAHRSRVVFALIAVCGTFGLARGGLLGVQARGDEAIEIAPGETTIRDLLLQLSTKTGAVIELPEHVGARKVFACFRRTTVRSALEALCQSNKWACSEPEPQKFIIRLKATGASRTLPGIAANLRSALPVDWQEFFAYTPDEKDVTDPLAAVAKRTGTYEKRIAWPLQSKRLNEIGSLYQDQLVAAIMKTGKDRKRLLYTDMSLEDRRLLVNAIVLDAFAQIFIATNGAPIFAGKLPRYVRDADSAEIVVKNGGILVQVTEEQGGLITGTRFGVSIESPPDR